MLTGNGFFSAWMAFAASLYYAYLVFFSVDNVAANQPVTRGPAPAAASSTDNTTGSTTNPQATTIQVTPTTSSV